MTAIRTEKTVLMVARSTATQGTYLQQEDSAAASYQMSADGAATTVICSALTESDDAWNGSLLECTDDLDGNLSQRSIITDFTAASDTARVETLPGSPSSDSYFRILKNTLPVFVARNGSGAVMTVSSSARSATNEPDDFWNGDYLRCISDSGVLADGSGNVGEMKKITDYETTTGSIGTCVVSAFPSAIATGDVFIAERVVNAEEIAWSPAQASHKRTPKRDTYAPSVSLAGARRGAELTFKVELKGAGTGYTDGAIVTRDCCPQVLLEAILGTRTTTGGTYVSDGTATTTGATVNAAAQVTEGMPTLINGEVTRVTSIDGTRVEWSPALSVAPAQDALVHGGAHFRRAVSGHSPLSFELWQDQRRFRLYSALGSATIDVEADGRLMLNCTFVAQSWDVKTEQCPVDIDISHTPEESVSAILGNDSPASFAGTDYEIASCSCDLGVKQVERKSTGAVDGNNGRAVVGGQAMITMNPIAENIYWWDTYNAGDTGELINQFGNGPGRCVSIIAPKAQLDEIPGIEDDEGLMREALSFSAKEPDSTDASGDDIIVSIF